MKKFSLLPNLSGKGVFVFSDPGGAKPVLAFLKLNHKLQNYKVFSDRSYDFFSDFDIPVTIYTEGDELKVGDTFDADFLFTGTSVNSSIEVKFIKAFKERKIKTYSFIDHYTRILPRYEWEGDYYFSDVICVLDEVAEKIVRLEIPNAEVIVSGNYFQEYIRNWIPKVSRETFLQNLGIANTKKIILFAPDPISRANHLDRYGKSEYGFDEYSVFQNLLRALPKESQSEYVVVIKMHPNQDKETFLSFIKDSGANVIIGDQFHTLTLLYYSNIIVGMFSNILIEGNILGAKVIRCLIDLKCDDPFEGKNVGEPAYELNQMKDLILNYLNDQDDSK
ncbi:CDP-glycerol glycerophosphotransferase family protein [Leptospira meyeri]|uniref:CDP-glycerol glycerophosphotransferase family protein n=1 Tax=Leptospira meyeri TaxID=29508 RepID=UPI0002BEDAB7|nr:CDP-glycerol glycerophosphotransferase family protein [Leptospira meyeri]EMJ86818.1 PF04007 domain protein [Leptospira meyeri serovar Semaranga str. Veldrot Semarang 173]